MFETVEDFLISQMSQRPVTFREIELSVNKRKPSIIREIRPLVRMGRIKIIDVCFQTRVVPFFTLRENIDAKILPFAKPRYLSKISSVGRKGLRNGIVGRRDGGAITTLSDDERSSGCDGRSSVSRNKVFKRRPRGEGAYLVASADEEEF